MSYTVSQYIDGQIRSQEGAKQIPIINPAKAEAIGQLEFASESTVNDAIAAAEKAFPSWSAMTPLKRSRILFKFKALLEEHRDEIATLVTQEHGKTLEDAQGSIARGIEIVEYTCGIAARLRGTFSENVGTDIDSYTIRQPLGVCAGITPFNFPVMVPIWMMIPAIACGNTFIIKPSEQAPSAPMLLVELLHQAGLPKGVVNLVNGDKETVDTLLHHPTIQAVTAVASTPVAEHIYKTAIAQGKRSHTFGGAKNHCVVMPDADMSRTAKAIAGAAFGSAGERCMAISVAVVVGDETADKLIDALHPECQNLTIGHGDAKDTDMGPLINQAHLEKVTGYLQTGCDEGATLHIDGRTIDHPKQGYFIGPSLFDHVTENMRVYQEEIFGPVLCVVRVDTYEQAIDLVNRHQFGNGTAIFTHDGHVARQYAHQVQAGMVGVNIPIPVPVAYHPFGGWKRSVFGDLNMHGEQSVQFYTKIKTVTTKWPAEDSSKSAYVMPTMD